MADWPAPSLLHSLAFENFWPGLVVFVALAVVLALSGLTRHSRPMLIGALVFALLAGANAALAFGVTTVRERSIDLTRQIIAAAIRPPDGALDVEALAALVDPNVRLEVPAGRLVIARRRALVDKVRAANDKYRVEAWKILQLDAMPIGEHAGKAYVMLNTQIRMTGAGAGLFAGGGQAVPSQWLIEWHRRPDGWCARRIVLSRVAGASASAGQLP